LDQGWLAAQTKLGKILHTSHLAKICDSLVKTKNKKQKNLGVYGFFSSWDGWWQGKNCGALGQWCLEKAVGAWCQGKQEK
jgi:hypothetical protein